MPMTTPVDADKLTLSEKRNFADREIHGKRIARASHRTPEKG